MKDTKLTAYLAENPRMVGVLFTALLLVNAGIGNVMAANGASTAGP